MQWINNKILLNLYFPDDAFIWYLSARKTALKLLKEEDFSLLISVSLPFTTHLVGLSLKKKFQDLKWIADTGDPFAFQPLHPLNNNYLYGKLNVKLEKKIAINADFVPLTNIGAVRLYQENFPNYTNKFGLIPPLSHPKNTSISSTANRQLNSKIKLGYFGSFFRKIREPKRLLNFMRELHQNNSSFFIDTEWHFYGNIFENFIKDFKEYEELKDKIFFHGLVSRENAERAMQEMNFLINVGNATKYQLPSKSTDYLASAKPIINLTILREDTFAEFFKDYPLIFNVFNGEISKKLICFLNENKNRKVNEEEIRLKCKPYYVENIAEKYMKSISD